MEYYIIPLIACIASLLTFFSGFGLGTILLPVFALFFSMPIAIAMTAIIHFLNNFFKFFLVRKHANWNVVIYFGLPALLAAFAGATALVMVSQIPPIGKYNLFGKDFLIEPLKIVLGVLLIFFTTIELKTKLPHFKLRKKHLFIGGILSGFFGGLSGFQGAFRSMFLINCKLSKEEFIASGVVIACLVDLARIPTYSFLINLAVIKNNFLLLSITSVAAFVGAFYGNNYLQKLTIPLLKIIIAIFIYTISICLILGLI